MKTITTDGLHSSLKCRPMSLNVKTKILDINVCSQNWESLNKNFLNKMECLKYCKAKNTPIIRITSQTIPIHKEI